MTTTTKRRQPTSTSKTKTKRPAQKSTTNGASKKRNSPAKSTTNSDKPKKTIDPAIGFISGIVTAGIFVVLLLSSISYVFTWKEDFSISSLNFLFETPSKSYVNYGGRVGAIYSQLLMGDLFGIGSFFIPFLVAATSMFLFGLKLKTFYKAVVTIITLSITTSIAATCFFPEYNGIFGSTLGGGVGFIAHNWLTDMVGEAGEAVTLIVLLTSTLVYISKDIFIFLYKLIVAICVSIGSLIERLQPSNTPNTHPVTTPEPTFYEVSPTGNQITATQNQQPIFEQPCEPLSDSQGNNTTGTQSINDIYSNNGTGTSSQQPTYEELIQTPIFNHNIEVDDEPELPINNFYDETKDYIDNDESFINSEESLFEPIIESSTVQPHEAYFTPKNRSIESVGSSLPIGFNSDDLVVLSPEDYSDSDDDFEFETYFREEEKEDETPLSSEEPEITIENPSPSREREEATSAIPRVKKDSSNDFIIERAKEPEQSEDFEIEITENADIVISNPEDLDSLNIKTNINEEGDETDLNEPYDPTKTLSRYKFPAKELMDNHTKRVTVTEEELFENKNRIIETLENFNIKIDKIKATIGPTVTLYEIIPAPGVRISKIKNLEDDIALSLSALGIRIIAPIPGKGTIGIEVPNKNKEIVSMYSVVKGAKFTNTDAELPIVLGRTIQNEDYVIDLAKTPHMLVAGATGQGKSVGLNAIITSLLYKKHPAELKFVFVDPKKVELTLYSSLERHFLAKLPGEDEAIITDTQKVVYTLNSMCILMDARYDTLKSAKVRNIKEYNNKFKARNLLPTKGHEFMPYFVVVIDEFADLIMTAGREIETPIARLAQLGRATGIHLVIATQRPTTNIITGVIKANFPTRVAFRVSSMIDSRTILDQPGANQLIGLGDMLISNGNETTRVQCAFIDTPEVERITDFIGKQSGYGEAYELPEYVGETTNNKENENATTLRKDGLFDEVARYIVTSQQGSASTIQRNFSIGFNRAGRIMDQLERAGIVGKQEGSKPRQVLISDLSSLEVLLYDMERQ